MQTKPLAVTLALLVVIPAAGVPPPAVATLNPLTHCGTERWHLKTLDDPGVNHIANVPKKTTVAAMVHLPVPPGYSRTNDTTRYMPVEETKYTLTARAVGFAEEADRDIHLVIADPATGETMIAEAPDPLCSTAQASGHAQQLSAARSAIIACFGQPKASNSYKTFGGDTRITLTGVGFFDFIHSPPQNGVAPNGIELHPLVQVKLHGNCPTGYTAQCACAVQGATPSSILQATQASRPQRRPAPTTFRRPQHRQR